MSTTVATRLVPAVARYAAASSLRAPSRSPAALVRRYNHPRRSLTTSTSLLAKKYTEDHEWIELDADGKTGTIGITEYAAQQLGDVVYVELPEVGSEVTKGDAIGAVESVKSASDILTPVTGTIVANNPSLEEKPGDINKAPEAAGWLAKIELADAAELDTLLDKDGYTKFTQEADE